MSRKQNYLITVKLQPVNKDNTLKQTEEIHCLQSVYEFQFPIDYEKFDREIIRAIFPRILQNISKNLELQDERN